MYTYIYDFLSVVVTARYTFRIITTSQRLNTDLWPCVHRQQMKTTLVRVNRVGIRTSRLPRDTDIGKSGQAALTLTLLLRMFASVHEHKDPKKGPRRHEESSARRRDTPVRLALGLPSLGLVRSMYDADTTFFAQSVA